MKKAFTTGQIAKLCEVAPRTVTKWFNLGKLLGYQIPGSQHRRIPRENLIKFMKANHIPLGDLESVVYHKILVVGAESSLLAGLREQLRECDDFRIETAASGFEAGIRAESFHPDCIVIDLAIGRIEAGQIVQSLRGSQGHAGVILVALTNSESTDEIRALGFSCAFRKPVSIVPLAEALSGLIAEKKNEAPKRRNGVAKLCVVS